MTSARRNVCVVEYKNAEGKIVRKTFASNSSNHSKELMIDSLKADNTPDAEVTYVVDYGVTREDGLNARNSLQGIL